MHFLKCPVSLRETLNICESSPRAGPVSYTHLEGAFSRQRSGEKRRDGSSPRVRKGAEGFSVSKKQNGEALNAERRREDSKRGGSYGGRGSRRSNSICPVLNLCGGCQPLDMEYAKQLAFKPVSYTHLKKDS